jgi:hypothetical protein
VNLQMSGCQSSSIIAKLGGGIKENWGLPFIAVFALLLLSVEVSLYFGLSLLANTVAAYAFYSLVIGVTLQLVSSIKYRKHYRGND